MDTHKEFCEIAYARDERTAQAEHYGRIKTTKAAIIKFAKQMQSKFSHATIQRTKERDAVNTESPIHQQPVKRDTDVLVDSDR
jgi:hypothetical protein